jgi:hypothetical protein
MKAAPSGRKPNSFDGSNPQGRQSGSADLPRQSGSAALVGSAEAAGPGPVPGDAMGARRFSTGTLQQLEGATADAVAAGGACRLSLTTSSNAL